MLSGESLRLVLMASGLCLSLAAIILTIRNRMVDKKRSLLIKHGWEGLIAQNIPGGEHRFQQMALTITVTNNGSVPIHINCPRLKLPKKIDGFDTYQLMNMRDAGNFPLRLEPGARYIARHSLRHFYEEFKNEIRARDKVRFQVFDNLGNSYFSKKVRFSVLVQHIETEERLLARDIR